MGVMCLIGGGNCDKMDSGREVYTWVYVYVCGVYVCVVCMCVYVWKGMGNPSVIIGKLSHSDPR